MGFRFNDLETGADAAGWTEEWYFPQRPIFLRSNAYDTLERELRGYVSGTITGRSFLIAAHRGVGKTSLVLRATDQLEREVIRKAVDGRDGPYAGRDARHATWQRPMLVKLNGSSLLAPPKNDGDMALTPAERTKAKSDAAGAASAETALQQITITLYRALAREVATAFALHARAQLHRAQGPRPSSRDLLEIAAQLTLDLDRAPELAGLRRAWDRLGRLPFGVLWPGVVTQRLAASGLRDLGLGEIVAIAAANQAFQVCTGRVEASESTKGSAQRETNLEVSAKLDLKDAANKLWSLTAGGLVGAAVLGSSGGAPAAIASGLGTALLSTLALGWSSTRSQRTERSADYTFIIDRSIQTLDRDLPVVIDRIRAAGLAPVFLIDELDKLEKPVESIATIIKRLKNLTTDYGFFCFLTDRAYFDEIERKLREEAYPPEHTFFSHRMLVLYRPAELASYVRALWIADPPGAPDDPQGLEALWILTCMVLHRAELNLTDVRREIGRLCDADGNLLPEIGDICSSPQYLVPMAMQLAFEHVLRHPDIRRRVDGDNAFAQLGIEVLYVIARAWDDGEPEVDLTLEAVRGELIARRKIGGDSAAQKAELAKSVPEADLVLLVQKTCALADLLQSFAGLRERILLEDEFRIPRQPLPTAPYASTRDSEQAKIATLSLLLLTMPGRNPGVVAPLPGHPSVYRFLFDRYGVEKSDASPAAQLQAVQTGITFLDDFKAAVAEFGFTLEELFAAGVLPANLNPATLEQSAARLRPVIELGKAGGPGRPDEPDQTGEPAGRRHADPRPAHHGQCDQPCDCEDPGPGHSGAREGSKDHPRRIGRRRAGRDRPDAGCVGIGRWFVHRNTRRCGTARPQVGRLRGGQPAGRRRCLW